MAIPILERAKNIYEQQAYNRRMTKLLVTAFILLIAVIGLGFDLFLEIDIIARIIILPFIILITISGLWNLRQRAIAGLWKEPEKFAEDDDKQYERLNYSIVFGGFSFLILIFLVIYSYPIKRSLNQHIDISMIEQLPIGTILAIFIGISAILISLRWGKNSVLFSVGANLPNKSNEESQVLKNVVKEMSIAAGIPTPAVYIVNDTDPNAFALGTNQKDSCIVVTSGLLKMMTREELQGVVAHEINHIRNIDTQLMTTITVLFGAVLLLSEWLKRYALHGKFSGGKSLGGGGILRVIFLILWLLTVVLAPLIAKLVAMAISRQREYLADAGAAYLTRNPKALAKALQKIENATEPTVSFQKGVAHLCVVDPLGRKVNSKEGWWANLLATHPPMKNRILLLNAMAYERTI